MGHQDRERRYIADYMLQEFPQGGWTLNVPLGEVPEEIVARYGPVRGAALFRPSRPRVDAVASLPDRYLLLEAKVREPKAAIGELLLYRDLAAMTMDLPGYRGQPIALRLVVPWLLDWVREVARNHALEVAVYLPAWIEDYIRERQEYFTAAYRQRREEKKRLRELYGVE